jgi:hypothetical protein
VRIVVEQKLRTRTLVSWLAALAVLEPATVFTIVLVNHAPIGGVVVAIIATILLWTVLLLAARVVVRVIRDVPEEPVLEIVYGIGIRLTQRFTKSEIASVKEIVINPWTSGGWGYRGSLRLMKQAALITRKGPGLELGLSGNRRFRVSVDAPQKFVEALQS